MHGEGRALFCRPPHETSPISTKVALTPAESCASPSRCLSTVTTNIGSRRSWASIWAAMNEAESDRRAQRRIDPENNERDEPHDPTPAPQLHPRRSDRDRRARDRWQGRVHCERCGAWCRKRADYQIDHVIAEGSGRPPTWRASSRRRTGNCCASRSATRSRRNGTRRDIGRAKRLEAAELGVKPPPRRKVNWGHYKDEKPPSSRRRPANPASPGSMANERRRRQDHGHRHRSLAGGAGGGRNRRREDRSNHLRQKIAQIIFDMCPHDRKRSVQAANRIIDYLIEVHSNAGKAQ